MGTASHLFSFFLPLSLFICISGAFDDDLSVFAVIMCAALALQKQLCYKPDIKTKLDACVPQHLGHQCPINTGSQSISLPSPLRSLMKPWVGNRGSGQYNLHAKIWDILTLTLAFTHRQFKAGVTAEILAASLWVRCKGHKRPPLTYLSLPVKRPVHENVTLSGRVVCHTGLCWPPWHTLVSHDAMPVQSCPWWTVNAFFYYLVYAAHIVSVTLHNAKSILGVSPRSLLWTNYMLTFTRHVTDTAREQSQCHSWLHGNPCEK